MIDLKTRTRIIDAVVSALESALEQGDEALRDAGDFHEIAEELEADDLVVMKDAEKKALIVRLILANDRFQKAVGDTADAFMSELSYATRERLGIEEEDEEG